jgi:hypothetical protein
MSQYDVEIFFPPVSSAFDNGRWIRERLPVLPSQLPSISCGWTEHKTWYFNFGTPLPKFVLKYREPGKRAGSERWATRKVYSVLDAMAWMNENKDHAFLPATVFTNSWKPEVVAILGSMP